MIQFEYSIYLSEIFADRGKFVKTMSGRNVLYNEEVDVSKLSPEDRKKYQAAMRSRRLRLKKKAERLVLFALQC